MMMMMMMKRVFLSIVDLPDFLSDWIRLECRQRASSSFGVSGSRLNRNRRRPVDGKWRWQRKRMTISRTTASYRSTNGWNSSSFPALWWRQFSGVDHKRWTQHQNGGKKIRQVWRLTSMQVMKTTAGIKLRREFNARTIDQRQTICTETVDLTG